MRRAAFAEAGPRASRPWCQESATSAIGHRSPERSPCGETEGGKLRRLHRAARGIGRQTGAVGWAGRNPPHVVVARRGDRYIVTYSPSQAGGEQHVGGGKPAAH